MSQALQYPNTVHLGIHDVLLKKSTVGSSSGSVGMSKGRLRGGSVVQSFGRSRGSSVVQIFENFPNSKQGLRIESLIIGNLRLQTGLALVMLSSGFSGAKITSGRMQSLTRLRANQGFSEASGLFGVSAHLRWCGAGQAPSQWDLLLVNAKLHELGTGYERTKQEVQKATQLGTYPIKGVRAVFSSRPSNLLPWIMGIEAYRIQDRTQNEDQIRTQNGNQAQNEWSWGLDVQTKHLPWYLAMGLSPTSAVFRVNAEPDWSPVHIQLKSFYRKDESSMLHAEMPAFGSDWGLFSDTRTEQGWEVAAQYHPSSTMNMYSAIGSSKEPKASGYERFPEQRSYWAVQLHYESNAIPLRMQFDIRRKVQQNTWRANAQIGYEFSPVLRIRARMYWTQANTQQPNANQTLVPNQYITQRSDKNEIATSTTHTGVLFYQEMRYAPRPWLRLDLRFSQFNNPSHHARLYEYEQDIRYQFSVRQRQGQGLAYYALLTLISPRKKDQIRAQLQLKYSYLEYLDRFSIGSPPLEIGSNIQRAVKAQIVLSF